jgi:thioredoxin-related protein
MKKIFFILLLIASTLFSDTLLKTDNTIVTDGKGVILFFESDACSYCSIMKKDFLENKEMNAIAKKFNIYLINVTNEKEYIVGKKKKKETTTTLRMAFASKASPNIVMFDKNWKKIFQIPGYADPKQMTTFMKFVHGLNEGTYKASQWKEFLKDNGVS